MGASIHFVARKVAKHPRKFNFVNAKIRAFTYKMRECIDSIL